MTKKIIYHKPSVRLPETGENVLVFMRNNLTGKLSPSIAWIVYDGRDRKYYWGFDHDWRCNLDDVVRWTSIEIPIVEEGV